MKRSELLKSPEYWMAEIQLQLFSLIENFRTKNKLTKTAIAKKLGVSKGYVTQVLNGDFDHKISKLVELSLAFDKVPIVHFVDAEKYIADDAQGKKEIYRQEFKPVQHFTFNGMKGFESSLNIAEFLPATYQIAERAEKSISGFVQ
jgi:transcriptional regulator with XRE-family HTH domain